MSPLLKRILVNGPLTAVFLAVVGFGYAELAGLFLTAKSPVRATLDSPAQPPTDPLADELQYRVPAMMALWGFVFVAVGEVVLHRWRSRKAAANAAAIVAQTDPTDLLLKQIMLDAEAAKAAPSPSSVPAENTPVAS